MLYKFAKDEVVLMFDSKEDPSLYNLMLAVAKSQDIETSMLIAGVCLETIFTITSESISFDASSVIVFIENGKAFLFVRESQTTEKPDTSKYVFDKEIPYPLFLRFFVVFYQRSQKEKEACDEMDPDEDYDDDLEDEEEEDEIEVETMIEEDDSGKTPEDFEKELEVEKVYYILPSLRELFYIRDIGGTLYKRGDKIFLYTKENHSLDEFYDRYCGPMPVDIIAENVKEIICGAK